MLGGPMQQDETPQQRAERYWQLARETAALGTHSRDPEIAAAFRSIALIWARLAREIREL